MLQRCNSTLSDLATETRIAAGAKRYAMLCVGCHLAPGVTHSDVRTGLYPHPPNLAQAEVDEERNAGSGKADSPCAFPRKRALWLEAARFG